MTLVALVGLFQPHRPPPRSNWALAKGKQSHDKRATIKDRDWKRDKARLMRDRAEKKISLRGGFTYWSRNALLPILRLDGGHAEPCRSLPACRCAIARGESLRA